MKLWGLDRKRKKHMKYVGSHAYSCSTKKTPKETGELQRQQNPSLYKGQRAGWQMCQYSHPSLFGQNETSKLRPLKVASKSSS
eukprot:1157613-Pelagomonas_calceolata.AAC.10